MKSLQTLEVKQMGDKWTSYRVLENGSVEIWDCSDNDDTSPFNTQSFSDVVTVETLISRSEPSKYMASLYIFKENSNIQDVAKDPTRPFVCERIPDGYKLSDHFDIQTRKLEKQQKAKEIASTLKLKRRK